MLTAVNTLNGHENTPSGAPIWVSVIYVIHIIPSGILYLLLRIVIYFIWITGVIYFYYSERTHKKPLWTMC